MKKENLSIRFIPYSEIAKLGGHERIKMVLDLCLNKKIVIIQGRLKIEEETSLIQSTMALIGRINGFKGVELAVISSSDNIGFVNKMRYGIARALVGEQDAVTLIGPATLVKQIKRDPKKIELLLNK